MSWGVTRRARHQLRGHVHHPGGDTGPPPALAPPPWEQETPGRLTITRKRSACKAKPQGEEEEQEEGSREMGKDPHAPACNPAWWGDWVAGVQPAPG